MARSAVRLTGWSRSTAGFAADLTLYVVIALVLWLIIPMLILGWTPVLITSGSMSPAVEPGDILLVERGVPEDEWFVPGTILTYEADPPAVTVDGDHLVDGDQHLASAVADRPRLVTHRVDRIDAEGNYVTRGDANSSSDPQPVAPEQVVGAARLLVPGIGLPVHWARDGRLGQLGLVALALVGTVYASRLDVQDGQIRARRRRGDGDGARDRRRVLRRDDVREEPDPETRAARAARAARAGGSSGLLTLPQRASDDEVGRPRGHRRTTTGLPAMFGILALSLGSLLPTAEAAFVESNANGGNHFSTAAVPDVETDVQIVDEWGDGYCADVTVSTSSATPIAWEVGIDVSTFPLNGVVQSVTDADGSVDGDLLTAHGLEHNATVVQDEPVVWSFCADRPPGSVPSTDLELPLHDGEAILDGDVGSGTTLSFQVTTDEEHYLAGAAQAQLRVRRRINFAGNSPGAVEVTLSTDGTVLTSGVTEGITDTTWHTVTFLLSPEVFGTFEAATAFDVEVTLHRIEMQVDGPSAIVMAGN